MASAAGQIYRPGTIRYRQIALPTEHGSWGFLLEPLVAGIAIAPTAAGLWIILMVVGGFLARRPLQVMFAQRRQKDRRYFNAAFRLFAGFSAMVLAGAVGTVAAAGAMPLAPFAAVLPIAAFQLYTEFYKRGRQLTAELSGALVMSSAAASLGLAGGLDAAHSAALALLFAARFLPAILYVRARLALEKGKAAALVPVHASHAAALFIVAALAAFSLVPAFPLLVFGVLLVRAVIGLSPYRRRVKAMKIGVFEVIYGALLVAAVITGYYLNI